MISYLKIKYKNSMIFFLQLKYRLVKNNINIVIKNKLYSILMFNYKFELINNNNQTILLNVTQ